MTIIDTGGSATAGAATGALTDLAAQDGDAVASTIQSLLKGVHDVIWDADGVIAWPAGAAPANGVSVAEGLRFASENVDTLLLSNVVPVADATANVEVSDVVGNKTDTSSQAIAADDSVVSYLKGIVDAMTGAAGIVTWAAGAAPANGVSLSEGLRFVSENIVIVDANQDAGVADAVTNALARDVVGNKTDVKVADTVAPTAITTNSIMAALKAVLSRLGEDSANNEAATTLVAANRDGSLLERQEDIRTNQDTLATGAALTTIHAVPAADAVTNTDVSDVVGNKTDTSSQVIAADDSAISYLKGLTDSMAGAAGIVTWAAGAAPANGVSLSEGVRFTSEAVAVVDGLHDVPGADAVTNAQVRDVVGNKTDTSSQVIAADDSIVSYLKGLTDSMAGAAGIAAWAAGAAPANGVSLSEGLRFASENVDTLLLSNIVPAADATANVEVSDVVGNKTDTSSQEIAADDSALSYLKGLVNAQTGAAGVVAWAAGAAPANGVSMSEGLRFVSENIVAQTPNRALKNLGFAALTTAASPVTAFTVTGDVEVHSICGVTGVAMTSTGGTGTLAVGTTNVTTFLIPTTTVDGANLGVTGDVWVDATPLDNVDVVARSGGAIILGGGADIIVTVATNNMSAGDVTLYVSYTPLSAGATVVAA